MDKDSQTTDAGQFIEQARNNPATFARLYRRHYEPVFHYCVHRLFDRHTAEDVTSAVFLSVVENFHRFKGSSEKQFRNWLYRIATNAVNSHLRKVARRGSLLKQANELVGGQTDNCEISIDESAKKLSLLKQAMLTLNPRHQTVITLHYFENLKSTEIAEVLGSSEGTVRSQLARALAKLRKEMAAFRQEI